MSEFDHVGLKTLDRCEKQVICTIRNNFDEISLLLKDNGIILGELYKQVTDPRNNETKDNKVRLVYQALYNKVEEDYRKYKVFIDCLHEQTIFDASYTVQKLKEAYKEVERQHQSRSMSAPLEQRVAPVRKRLMSEPMIRKYDIKNVQNTKRPMSSQSLYEFHDNVARIDQNRSLYEEPCDEVSLSNQDSCESVEDIIRDLQSEFRKIREEFQTYLESNRENCISFCKLLKRPIDTWIGLEHYFSEIELKEMKLEDIFEKLRNKVLNFMDFEILHFLIKECGEPELYNTMTEYTKKVKSKCWGITVTQLVAHWDPPVFASDVPESFKTCVAEMRWDPNTCKAEELRKLRRRFEELIPQRIGMAAFVLVYVLKKSVMALWLVFTYVWPHLREEIKRLIHENSDFVKEIQLAVFILDDFIFYPCSDREKLWNASREGATGVVKELLQDLRVDPNVKYEIFQRTALQCATKYGQQNIAKLLLEHGADINYQDARGCTALMIALRSCQSAMAEYLLNQGADINISELVLGMSSLLFAVRNNDVQMFELLKRYHADLNARDKDGRTALIIAAENGNEEIVRSLVSEGEEVIDMEAQDDDGRTAIHAATKCGWTKIVEVLLKYPNALFLKDTYNNTPNNIAVESKNMELEDLFRPYFLDDEPILMQDDETVHDPELTKPLTDDMALPEAELPQASGTIAGGTAHTKTVSETKLKTVLQAPEGKKEELRTKIKLLGQHLVKPLHYAGRLKDIRLIRAASIGDAILTEKLLKKGAYPNTRRLEIQGWTPLMIASQKGHTSVAKVLLKHRADPNIMTITAGYTALIIASKEGNHDIVECLIDPSNPVPLDIEAVNATSGWGPLMWASQSRFSSEAKSEKGIENRCKLIQSLVKAGVNINKPVENGWIPLMQASQDNNLKLVQMMCKIDGIDLDHESNSSWTAITTACRKGNEDIVIELTEAGADINKKKKGGYTALHMACYKGLLKAVKCMVPLLKDGTRQGRKIRPDVNVKDNWGMTPLILATKQGHHDVAKYLISTDQPQINIRAERYAQWTAVFFAIRNGDENILDLLVENLADMTITDENNITPANYAKSLFINKQMHKLLEHKKEQQKQKQQQQEEQPKVKDEDPVGRSSSIVDVVKYNQVELIWRTRQQIYLTLNI